ncbi:ATP-dependent nuclease [Ruegeria arenilitoris]|uniref:ATP-dependent nuclease n=1 Tax=Ruegeria arenilitoris TaxID=1173585 RepID=UPI0014819450|nr:AAA family ATPase [Ruegeria arenilitoris]
MRYTKFEIQNFKGIQNAEIDFGSTGSAKVFSLVGLNESGKTTVLEAIHSFAPDRDANTVVGNERAIDEQRRLAVPRSKISDFTGKVSIKAHLLLDEGDREKIVEYLKTEYDLRADPASIPDRFSYERYSSYENGNLIGSYYDTSFELLVKTKQQRKFRVPIEDETTYVSEALRSLMPSIAYFPSFVFEFPERIFLSSRPAGAKNAFYRRLFQDILDFGGRGHTIREHIVSRIRKEEYRVDWVGFLPVFKKSNEKQQVDQVIDHAARTVTGVVYRKWNDIFGEEVGNKEIIIDWDVDQGQKYDLESKSLVDTNDHDIYVEFQVKDGPDRFSIGTRSLGFRWFFSFLLFTQFRANRNSDRSIVFLLDEPASNLHASAQQKLIDSFPEIVGDRHMLVYSTHSHYMIEPTWLEQAFIVQNKPTLVSTDMIDAATLDDSSVNIQVTPYRRFLGSHAASASYFQPIIDRLSVVPSKFDLDRVGVILEGKSDYYILEYFKWHLKRESPALYPARGAGTLSALIALLRGWGLPVRVVLDSDKAGEKELKRYTDDFFLLDNEISLLGSLDSACSEIEDIFSSTDKEKMGALVGKTTASKKDILVLVQEYLSSRKKLPLENTTIQRVRELLNRLDKFQQ